MSLETYWKSRWEKALYGGQYSEREVAVFVADHMKLTEHTTLLDVGCGGGLLLKNLPAKQKTGMDYSKGRIAEAKKNVPDATFDQGDAAKLPYADGAFDRVLSHSTFMYYTRPYAEKALSEMERVCKTGGIIMVGDVEDADKYPGGRGVYELRTLVLQMLGQGHYTALNRKFFEERGYFIVPSPFNKRFYAIKTKTD